MNMYRDGYSSTFSSIYFLAVVVFGAFFMVNLFFAVMWEQFSAIADIESRKVRRRAGRVTCQRHNQLSTFSARRMCASCIFLLALSVGEPSFCPSLFAGRAARLSTTLIAATWH